MDLLNELDNILSTENIKTLFQPIVSLRNGNIIGYEALSRGPENSSLHNPETLFSVAEKFNRLWKLECICRRKAIERASSLDKDKYLFINVDPLVFKDEGYKKGVTKKSLSEFNMSPESIIFEITERTCINDYKSFKKALENYYDEGYKIAIDDTGSGYSGLKTLSHVKPNYIKVDIDLIRNIHLDSFKQNLISSILLLANRENMQVIAEGIEMKEELLTLLELGVHAAQGYYLKKPSEVLSTLDEAVVNLICNYNKTFYSLCSLSDNYIGTIAQKHPSFTANTSCNDLKNYFDNSSISGACIVKQNIPVGLVMKNSLDSTLATQYGVAVFSKRPVNLIMDKKPLVVDYYSSVNSVSSSAMAREEKNIYDFIIVTKNSEYYGIVSIKSLLQHTTTLETNYAKELNPLTGLPGNILIEKNLNSLFLNSNEMCILYFDLDNFKVYNDCYGFENGDKLIKYTSNIIINTQKELLPHNNFIGHIGGDDFIMITDANMNECHILCEKIIAAFDENIYLFFNKEDVDNGFIEGLDRKGLKDRFDITSLSIAGIYGNISNFQSTSDLSKYMAAIKKEVKELPHSNYTIKIIENR